MCASVSAFFFLFFRFFLRFVLFGGLAGQRRGL
jgi:hypothetical protein